MFAVIATYKKNSTKDEVTYTKVKAEDLVNYLIPDMDIEFNMGAKKGEVFIFETEEEAERSMKAG